jgi:hypothetical protein
VKSGDNRKGTYQEVGNPVCKFPKSGPLGFEIFLKRSRSQVLSSRQALASYSRQDPSQIHPGHGVLQAVQEVLLQVNQIFLRGKERTLFLPPKRHMPGLGKKTHPREDKEVVSRSPRRKQPLPGDGKLDSSSGYQVTRISQYRRAGSGQKGLSLSSLPDQTGLDWVPLGKP